MPPPPPLGEECKCILQRAGVEGQNRGHMPPATAPHPERLGGGNRPLPPPLPPLQAVWEPAAPASPSQPLPPPANPQPAPSQAPASPASPCHPSPQPRSESAHQAAHIFRENLSHIKCFPFDSERLFKGMVWVFFFSPTIASFHTLGSQPQFC